VPFNRFTAPALLLSAAVAFPLAAQNRPASRTATVRTARTVWSDEGPAKWAPRPTDNAISANDLRTRLYQFADDSMMGRRIGEVGNYKGTEYIASEFKRLGLKPAGENGGYFQTLPFGPIGFDPGASTLSVNGKALTPKKDWIPTVPTAANGFGGTVEINGVPAVYAGQWGDSTTMIDLNAYRGKVIVFSAAPSQQRVAASTGAPVSFVSCADVPDKFGANAAIAEEARQRANPTAPPARRAVPTTLRDPRATGVGAVAVLVIGLDDMAPQAVDAAFAQPMGMRPAQPLNASAPGAATISRAAAEQLFGKKVADLRVGDASAPISASFKHQWRMSPTPARNVIAVLLQRSGVHAHPRAAAQDRFAHRAGSQHPSGASRQHHERRR